MSNNYEEKRNEFKQKCEVKPRNGYGQIKFLKNPNFVVNAEWKEFLLKKEVIDELNKIYDKVYEQPHGKIYPEKENVLRFLELPVSKLKCIVVGLDPYTSDEATGRSFEVNGYEEWTKGTRRKSLINILKAFYKNKTGENEDENTPAKFIRKEIKKGEFKILPPNQIFGKLEKEGIMFLNTALTVESGKVGGHIDKWENFQKELTKFIMDKNGEVKWALWGEKAQKMYKDLSDDRKITAPHPATAEFTRDYNPIRDIEDKCGVDFSAVYDNTNNKTQDDGEQER